MRVWRRVFVCVCVLAALLGVMGAPVGAAKVTEAKAEKPRDVRKAEEVAGTWEQRANGYGFRRESGDLVKNAWIKVDGNIYYINKAGCRVTGWIDYLGRRYLAQKDGALYFGWYTKGKKTYYLRENGVMAKGKLTIDGVVYHFNKKNGVRTSGWANLGRKRCYFDKNTGQMKQSTWIKTDKKYYYVGKDGVMLKSCWLVIGDKRYYLGPDGARLTGTHFLDGKGYYFKKNGVYDPSVKVQEVDPTKKMVALTFDDGPGAYTNRLLDCLQKNNAKATFFMVGTNVSRYASAVKRMASLGCELGNHSYDHARLDTLSYNEIAAQVASTNAEVYKASGEKPTVFRLPYGSGHNNSAVLTALGLPSIYWSIDTRDWANTDNPQSTVDAVLNHVRNGDIVLMHDIHASTVSAAERIIPALKQAGYQLVTVSQLAKYKGNTTLQTGRTYYNFY